MASNENKKHDELDRDGILESGHSIRKDSRLEVVALRPNMARLSEI